MHEAAFSQAALPRQACVLGTQLQDYCISHELWLWRRENAFATGAKITRKDLMEAVLICAHTADELHSPRVDCFFWLKRKLLNWRSRNIAELDFSIEAVEFANYRLEGSSEPITLEARPGPGPQTPQRAAGAPFLLRLLQFMIFTMRLTERQALAYKFGLAKWHYCTHFEAHDALRIKNADELRAENEIAGVEALVAGGMGWKEAFERVRAEQEIKEAACPA